MNDLIAKLEAIAAKNDDAFTYAIHIEVRHGKISYLFVAKEQACGHEFVTGCGHTIEQAVADAAAGVDAACRDWSYEQ